MDESESIKLLQDAHAIYSAALRTAEQQRLEVERLAVALINQANHKSEANQLIGYVYWEIPDVRPTSLAELLNMKVWQIQRRAGMYSISIPCSTCGDAQSIQVKSRSHVIEKRSRGIQCALCEQAAKDKDAVSSAAWREEYQQEKRLQEERRIDLHTMPYREYLKTPEWQERRATCLRRARFRCQVCNSGDQVLNVHHRTYERRGFEEDADLIALCAGCHQVFHDRGELAVE